MKASELRELSENELNQRIKDSKKELMKLRFSKAKGELKDISSLPKIRKDIARTLSVLNSKSERSKK